MPESKWTPDHWAIIVEYGEDSTIAVNGPYDDEEKAQRAAEALTRELHMMYDDGYHTWQAISGTPGAFAIFDRELGLGKDDGQVDIYVQGMGKVYKDA